MAITKERDDGRALVVKSNDLIEASYRLTLNEQRIVAFAASRIKRGDSEFKLYRIKISELQDLIGGNKTTAYKRLKSAAEALVDKSVTIRRRGEDDRELSMSWAASAEYFGQEGVIEFEFSQKLKPYLLGLTERFTTFQLRDFFRLRSQYSMRILELLRQYEGLKRRTFQVQELRELLGIKDGEYKAWRDFNRRVLVTAQKELAEKTNIAFDYRIKTKGRRADQIVFEIRRTATELTSSSVQDLREKAGRCWEDHKGECGIKWEQVTEDRNKNAQEEQVCYYCSKFQERAEGEGQQRLF